MKIALANFRSQPKQPVGPGIVMDGKVFSFADVFPDHTYMTMAAAYADWERVAGLLRSTLRPRCDGTPVSDVDLLPPSMAPSALYFAGFNYRDHVANMMEAGGLPHDPDPKEVGQNPWHGLKPPNTLCGNGATVKLPTSHVDWEVELAVVIGRPARNVSEKDALRYIAGYTIGIDLSARDRAFRPHAHELSVARMDWIAQKGFDGACPLGPWLTLADDIPDPQDLQLSLSVNNTIKQDSSTSQMIFSVAEAVSHLSTIITLSPGDIILTGTPAGTGAESGEFLSPGDVIRASIERIGELTVVLA